jgi:hypothetical protein
MKDGCLTRVRRKFTFLAADKIRGQVAFVHACFLLA